MFLVCTLILSGLRHGVKRSKASLTFQSAQRGDLDDGAFVFFCVCAQVGEVYLILFFRLRREGKKDAFPFNPPKIFFKRLLNVLMG